jgi:magnesium chelatase family protein
MLTKIYSATTVGVDAHLVEVEVDLSMGLLNFFIVGLPDTAIKESKQRVQAALKNSGIKLPERKITVNLAPADLKKEGSLFDLPIALGILIASGALEISQDFLKDTIILGELSLDGSIKPVKGVLPIAFDAKKFGKKRLIVASQNAIEASIIENLECISVESLVDLVEYLKGKEKIPVKNILELKNNISELDFNQIKGQEKAKRALQIAATGWHNLLFIGSPGSGKTMLAQRITSLMPDLTFDQAIETSKIYSISGKCLKEGIITARPFRSPHHSISQAGLIGGGSIPQPGEISLANNGILFLDELTEFKKSIIEALRQPLEEKIVNISRAQQSVSFPASFLLICALNPCPCGYYGDVLRTCNCPEQVVKQYLSKLSGPLLDRIDIQIHVPSLTFNQASSKSEETSSKELKNAIDNACKIQFERFGKHKFNSQMTHDEIEKYCKLDENCQKIIEKAFDKLKLSMRGYHKLLKISRTIADIEASINIEKKHIQEALSYRNLDSIIN